ncbi:MULTISPECIES: NAD(P)/FAD-dependent oxidoreductase [unclassified Pseudomonas]|uniref:NAD(P)/FAD-dependent oxidoreductase n=1 Tax=unclassified Pseudomonas TaxID=196821 RepID=UPI0002A3605C|nr:MULTISPECIES: FAD-dependent oxidoreductase [unclassified Pseudomonas]MBB1606090.1 FAD-containing monooxygenase EthA [Pseudomonas sp. UMC76]MBB1636563.1 FAD-containing monooxygenase EthA [Pseudomonas sp. UME83]NTX92273.1 FAD-containing monooxygenase EthA [Pseudomonas sp. UMA643]NTY19945.1 FAD-containing monooxygenase EthA [Pseudomonas sp. UMC3103]NTY27683.1 FAD-containing monooxygenase EthA [Pseudomonas sp. UMA603]
MKKDVAIVGAGHAGVSLAFALRNLGFAGSLALLSDEADLPYHRPPLSKAFMAAGDDAESERRLQLESAEFYAEKGIDLLLDSPVESIEPASHGLLLRNGERLEYGHLVLATGARARRLPLPGAELQGIQTLRTLEDARRIRQRLATSQRVVVVGGGFIGLELAATAAALGKQVTVLENASRIMERSVAPLVSEYVAQRHAGKGIRIETGCRVSAFRGDGGQVCAVLGENGEWPADLVIVGAGAQPNSELAEAAGIACGNGILVDGQMRTSAPDVFAIGDCAAHENPYAGNARIRLESIQNANDQARVVAQVIHGDACARYHTVPWFWSDQGEIKLQMIGLSADRTDCVVRGEPASGRFSVFHYRGDELIGVDSINQPLDHITSRKLLAAGLSPDKAAVANTSVELKSLLG